jgi:hypothetical protein
MQNDMQKAHGASGEAAAHKSIEALRQQCLAACTAPTHKVCRNNSCVIVSGAGSDECSLVGASCGEPSQLAPGTINVAYVFDAEKISKPFNITVEFTGQLGQKDPRATGMQNFKESVRAENVPNARGRRIVFVARNLRAGSWLVTANAGGLAGSGTCPNEKWRNPIILPPGGLKLVTINVTGLGPNEPARCE